MKYRLYIFVFFQFFNQFFYISNLFRSQSLFTRYRKSFFFSSDNWNSKFI